MVPIARNITMEAWGFLAPGHSRILDRDEQDCPARDASLEQDAERLVLHVLEPGRHWQ